MKNDNSNIKTLFLTFLKIGVFTFGGGYAMIALLETEFCVRKNWLDKREFLDMTAISESTPGPTAVNSATYIGYKIGGVLGAIAATVGVCIPSFFIKSSLRWIPWHSGGRNISHTYCRTKNVEST